jgi:hypothetical protein
MSQWTAKTELEDLLAVAGTDRKKIGALLDGMGKLVHQDMTLNLQKAFSAVESMATRYSFCTAEALVWAEYAVRSSNYLEEITRFLQGQCGESSVDWTKYAGRYGPDALRDACSGYLEFRRAIPARVSSGQASAKELLDFQNSSLIRAIDLSKRHWLRNFGTWLFCGPFKVSAIMTPGIWEESALQMVYMPLGGHVSRAFRALARRGVEGIVPSLLEEKESGLADGAFSTLVIAHSFQRDLARKCCGSVLHINTGLHLIGGGDRCI